MTPITRGYKTTEVLRSAKEKGYSELDRVLQTKPS